MHKQRVTERFGVEMKVDRHTLYQTEFNPFVYIKQEMFRQMVMEMDKRGVFQWDFDGETVRLRAVAQCDEQ